MHCVGHLEKVFVGALLRVHAIIVLFWFDFLGVLVVRLNTVVLIVAL